MLSAAGECSRRSIASTTTRWRAGNLAGGPSGILPSVLQRLRETGEIRGPLAKRIGAKGYHAEKFAGAPYPVRGS